jgi:hypothetical protein
MIQRPLCNGLIVPQGQEPNILQVGKNTLSKDVPVHIRISVEKKMISSKLPKKIHK